MIDRVALQAADACRLAGTHPYHIVARTDLVPRSEVGVGGIGRAIRREGIHRTASLGHQNPSGSIAVRPREPAHADFCRPTDSDIGGLRPRLSRERGAVGHRLIMRPVVRCGRAVELVHREVVNGFRG